MCLASVSVTHDAPAYDAFCSSLIKLTRDRDGATKQATLRSGAGPGKKRKAAKFETPLLPEDRTAIIAAGRGYCLQHGISMSGDSSTEKELQYFIRGILRGYIQVERRELLRANPPTTDALAVRAPTQEAARVSYQQLAVCQQSLVDQNARCLELQQENAALSASFKKHTNELSAQVTICWTTDCFRWTNCGVLLQIEKSVMMATQRERSRALHFETRRDSGRRRRSAPATHVMQRQCLPFQQLKMGGRQQETIIAQAHSLCIRIKMISGGTMASMDALLLELARRYTMCIPLSGVRKEMIRGDWAAIATQLGLFDTLKHQLLNGITSASKWNQNLS